MKHNYDYMLNSIIHSQKNRSYSRCLHLITAVDRFDRLPHAKKMTKFFRFVVDFLDKSVQLNSKK